MQILLGTILKNLLDKIWQLFIQRFRHRSLSEKARSIAQSFIKFSVPYLRESRFHIKGIGQLKRTEINEIESAWRGGVNSVLLVGKAGSGKSGIAVALAKDLRGKGTPVLFIQATDLIDSEDPVISIKHRLALSIDIGEAFSELGKEQECALIVDQLDSVVGSGTLLIGLTSLMKSISSFEGIRVLGVTRTFEATENQYLKNLNFEIIESHELTFGEAKKYLNSLGISSPSEKLIEIAQNLLNLSLISEVVSDEGDVSEILGQAQLWEKFLETIKEREGNLTLQLAIQLADYQLSKNEREIPIAFSKIIAFDRLISRGILIQSSFGRCRFRHEQLKDFICAYAYFPNRLLPQSIVSKYGRHSAKNVVTWLHALYRLKSPEEEPSFVRTVLEENEEISFYTQAVILDEYLRKSVDELNPDVIQVILDAIRSKQDLRDYFFKNSPDPTWAYSLWENGFFSSPPPLKETENGVLIEQWDVQIYLVSIADKVPDLVVRHFENLKAHGWYISQAIRGLLRIPSIEAIDTLPTLLMWLNTPDVATQIVYETQDLLIKFIAEGYFDEALDLFQALSKPILRSDYKNAFPTTYMGEPIILLHKDVLNADFYPRSVFVELAKLDSKRLADILDGHLRDALKLEAQSLGRSEFEISSGWRNAVEKTGQDILETAKDQLLENLLEALDSLMDRAPFEVEKFLKRYLLKENKIFKRLALYLIQRYPDNFSPYVIEELNNYSNLFDHSIHHEYFLLLASGFPLLSPSDQDKLINTILQGPPHAEVQALAEWAKREIGANPEKYAKDFINLWIRDLLWMVRVHLRRTTQEMLEDLIKEYGEPEHPSFTTWMSSGHDIHDISPVSEEDLSTFLPADIAQFVRTWKPDPDQFFSDERVSYEGLAGVLARTIINDPFKYKNEISNIAMTRPEIASAILGHFENSERIPPDVWSICIKLCEDLIQDSTIRTSMEPSPNGSWIWVRQSIIRLLNSGFLKDSHKIPAKLLERAREIILILINDPDPLPDQENAMLGTSQVQDPLSIALNHVRPSAVETLIRYAQVHSKYEKDMSSEEEEEKSIRLEPMVRKTLSKKLNRSIDPSRAVQAIFGLYLPLLYWLDKEWVLQHIDKIFPEGEDVDSSWNCAAAWDAFLYGNRFYPHLMNILRNKYEYAVENLVKGYQTRPDVVGNFSIHIVWEYLLGNYEIDSKEGQDSLIYQFFKKCKPDHRAMIAWACWRIINEFPDKVENYWPKICALWVWRNQVARAVNHTNDFDTEMLYFARILPLLPESETVLSLQPLLEGLLPHVTNIEIRNRGWDSIEEFLAKEVEYNTVRVIKYYRSMRERRTLRFPPYFKSVHTRKILEVAAANKESQEIALSLIDWIARNEKNHQYRDIYEQYAH